MFLSNDSVATIASRHGLFVASSVDIATPGAITFFRSGHDTAGSANCQLPGLLPMQPCTMPGTG
jgi:hypothetical protein